MARGTPLPIKNFLHVYSIPFHLSSPFCFVSQPYDMLYVLKQVVLDEITHSTSNHV